MLDHDASMHLWAAGYNKSGVFLACKHVAVTAHVCIADGRGRLYSLPCVWEGRAGGTPLVCRHTHALCWAHRQPFGSTVDGGRSQSARARCYCNKVFNLSEQPLCSPSKHRPLFPGADSAVPTHRLSAAAAHRPCSCCSCCCLRPNRSSHPLSIKPNTQHTVL